jgi:hypothetical protein
MSTPCGPQYGNGKGVHARPAGSRGASVSDGRDRASTSAFLVESLVEESAALRGDARASEDADVASAAVRRRNERSMGCGCGGARAVVPRAAR